MSNRQLPAGAPAACGAEGERTASACWSALAASVALSAASRSASSLFRRCFRLRMSCQFSRCSCCRAVAEPGRDGKQEPGLAGWLAAGLPHRAGSVP